ncbi:hypothetical protein D3C80_1789540 [compost metagenome]
MTREEVDQLDRLDPDHPQQRVVEFVEHALGQGRGVDVHVGRDHLHRIQVEVARPQQCQDFLSDTHSVNEGDVDSHGDFLLGQRQQGDGTSRSVPLRCT